MRIILLFLLLLNNTYATKLYKNKESVLYSIQHELITLNELDISYRNDKEIVLLAVKKNGLDLEYASDTLKRNREVVLTAVSQNGSALAYASQNLKRDKEVVLIAIKNSSYAKDYVDNTLLEDKANNEKSEIFTLVKKQNELEKEEYTSYYQEPLNEEEAFKRVQKDPYSYSDLNETFKHNQKIIYEALTQIGYGLEYAESNLSNNRDLMLKVVGVNSYAFENLNDTFKKDKEIVLKAIEYNSEVFQYADKSLKNDKEFLTPIIEENIYILKYCSPSIKKDKEYLLTLLNKELNILPFVDSTLQKDSNFINENIKKTGYGLKYATKEQQENKEFVLKIIRKHEDEFQYTSPILKKDQEFILSLVNDDDYIYVRSIFEHVAPELKSNRDFVIKLLKKKVDIFSLLSPTLQNDYQIKMFSFNQNLSSEYYLEEHHKALLKDNKLVLKMVRKSGSGVKYLYKEQQNDRKLMLQAFKNSGQSFPFISKALQYDRDFIKEILQSNGNLLSYIDDKFKNDKELVEIAIKNSGSNLIFASKPLRSDKELIKKALKEAPYYFSEIIGDLKEDKKFILELLKTDGSIITELSEELQKNEEFITLALKTYPKAIQYKDSNKTSREEILSYIKKDGLIINSLDEKYKKDKEVIALAIKDEAYSFTYIDEKLQKDKTYIIELIKINTEVANYINKELLKDKAFLTQVIQLSGYFFEKASDEQKKDKAFVLNAIRIKEDNLEYADKSIQDNREIILEAIKRDGYALQFASVRLQSDKELVLKAIKSYAEPFKYASKSLSEDRTFIEKAIEVNSFSIIYVQGKLHNDKELIIKALHQNKDVAIYLDEIFLNDKAFIKMALEKNIPILTHASNDIKKEKGLIALSERIEHPYQGFINFLTLLAVLSLLLFVYLMVKKTQKRKAYLFVLSLVLFTLVYWLKIYFVHGVYSVPYQVLNNAHPYGLKPVKCWVDKESNLSNLECYDMYVPEIYANDKNESNSSRTISFPVRIFRTKSMFSSKAPFLHLGGGGPGADMGLDYVASLNWVLQGHNSMSTKIDRDLIVIDPRGTGLAKPLLNCTTYGDNFKSYLDQHLSVIETIEKKNKDYKTCIEKLKKEHVNFNGYNSLTIAKDIELLRQSLSVPKWTLFGVSYSTIYAQYIANYYPETVESMVLDSACFPNIMIGDHYVKTVMDGYNALYTYPKEFQDKNETNVSTYDVDNIPTGIWAIHEQLTQKPLKINSIDFELDGDTFISSLWEGVYGIDIFKDLPKILSEMENNNSTTFLPYLKSYLYQHTNNSYADLSMITHECFEQQPFVDIKKIKDISKSLPDGYIKEMATDNLSSFEFCDFMNIQPIEQNLSKAFKIDIPTLFISGRYDSITPISDIKAQMQYFKNAQLLVYRNAHAVINNDKKMEKSITDFIKHPFKKIIVPEEENLTYTENNLSL